MAIIDDVLGKEIEEKPTITKSQNKISLQLEAERSYKAGFEDAKTLILKGLEKVKGSNHIRNFCAKSDALDCTDRTSSCYDCLIKYIEKL